MIIDSHAHIFPFLGGASGFASEEEHRLHLALVTSIHTQPIRRLSDHKQAFGAVLGDGVYKGPESFSSAQFRVGRYGRFEWTQANVDYYRQYMPPSLQNMEVPSEYLLQEMVYTDVDLAVLQNAPVGGRLNGYFAEACQKYPGRFIPLADVDEPLLDKESEIARLRDAVTRLGMRGIYYKTRGHFVAGYSHWLDDSAHDGYWEEVRRLGIVVFWEILGVPKNTLQTFLRQLEHLNVWADRFPDIPSVLTHGVDPDYLYSDVPGPLMGILRREQFLIEVLYPIVQGRVHDYPYAALRPAIRRLYRLVGGERIVWGSDFPNVLRHCTYKQSRSYLEDYCDFIGSADMDRILGGNLAMLFRL